MQKFSHRLITTLFLFVTLVWSGDVLADERRLNDRDIEHPLKEDLLKFEGLRIDSIEIDNREIYDTRFKPYNNFFFRTANKIHIKTKRSVLARELLFKTGDRFMVDLALETTRNLRNRYIIYDAWVEVTPLSDSTILIKVVTIDEWSFAGGFEISREGNEYRYEISFEERNFIGLNQFVSLDYIIQEKDENYFESYIRDYRFLGKPVNVSFTYSGNPKSEVQLFTAGHPFYSLTQKYAYGFYIGAAKRRNEVFNNTNLIGSSVTSSDLFGSSLSYRYGERVKNVVGIASYDYNLDRTAQTEIIADNLIDSNLAAASFPSDSLYHQVGLALRGFLVDFTTFRKVDGFGYTEDFTLGQTASVGYARAFNADFDDHVYDNLYFDFSFGHSFANELFYLTYVNTNKFKGGRDFQKTSTLIGSYYHRGPDFLTVAFRGLFRRDWRREGTESLILGGSSGIRGYPTEFRTGDRMSAFSLETRFHPNIHLLSTVLGLTGFLDAGRTYKPGQKVTLNDLYFSGGIGLRFALDRSSKSRFFRIDLAFSDNSRWQLSLSTGQYFSYTEHRLFLTSR